MAKKKKAKGDSGRRPRQSTAQPIFTSPFKALRKMLAQHSNVIKEGKAVKPAAKPELSPPNPAPPNDDALLHEAYKDVRPLGAFPARLPVEPRINREVISEEAEVLAQLSDLISGQGKFDISETEEYVEGARKGLDPRLLSRLRKGEFSLQGHLDLHGKALEGAKEALAHFIVQSVREGLRTVLVVHGRGLGSPGGRPVLKQATVRWLSQRALSGYVLAFATARPFDGGAGAMYVLLRRERRRAPFDVLEGAKRRD